MSAQMQESSDIAHQEGVPQGRFLELPGRGYTFIREAGDKDAPVLFLLHGLGATGGTNYAYAFSHLAEKYRVIAPDHRGHGRGLRSRKRFTLEDCADDVAAIAEVLGIATFGVVGYSMGGPIAQLVWYRHPRRVDSMVLCATSRNFRGRWRERAQYLGLGALVTGMQVLPRRAVAGLMEPVLEESSSTRKWGVGELMRSDPRSVLEAAEALGRFTSHEWIHEIDIPVSVLVMTDDHLVPPRRQVKLAQAIPTAVMHVVEAAHLACTTAPERFAKALVEACDLAVRRAAEHAGERVTDRSAA